MRPAFLIPLACLCALPAADRPDARPPAPKAPAPKTLRVAAVQMRSTRDLDANVKHHVAWLERLAADRVDVAVFPECSVSGYFDDLIPKLSARSLKQAEASLRQACKDHKIWAVVGSPVRDGGKLFNSALVIDDAGQVRERYHKLVRLPVLAGARVVFYLSHESPLAQEHKLGPYRAQIQARAVENGVFVVHANAPANPDATGSHGQSRLIDPEGTILQEATMFKEEALTATLGLARASAGNAKRSLTRGPLTAWWREGLKHVRQVD